MDYSDCLCRSILQCYFIETYINHHRVENVQYFDVGMFFAFAGEI
ncbi:MAG: hypothetical protein ACI89T_001862 [Cognaticolwellia sp.]|jgi:hypothetical protein